MNNKEEIKQVIISLKETRDKLALILSKQKEINKKIINNWGGSNGEKAYETLENHSSKYDTYLEQINKDIEHLESI